MIQTQRDKRDVPLCVFLSHQLKKHVNTAK
jgi:hypothetical protein